MDLDIVPCDIHDVFRRRLCVFVDGEFVNWIFIWYSDDLFFLFHIQVVQINKINSSWGAEKWILYEIFVHFSLRRRANWAFHISMNG